MPLSQTEQLLANLVQLAITNGLITADDRFFAVNRLIARLKIETVSPELGAALKAGAGMAELPASAAIIIDDLVDDAVRRQVCADLSDLREILAADLMAVFLDKPSTINSRFWQLYSTDPRQATGWFYQLSRDSNYIQTARIARNICYQAPSAYGMLDITINLSKPEKNPRDIAAAKTAHSGGYPLCLLCAENEGYAGRAGYPARANHRMIRLTLGKEPWYFQYSPYSYYNEHCIVLSETHRDMKIDRIGFQRLLEFTTLFPHYFVGSNADLPIVGGSILTHDHYQGGQYEFAMAKAGEDYAFTLPDWPAIHCAVVRWPMSVLRLSAADPELLIAAADFVLAIWREYSDPAAEILAWSDQAPHNTLTPIARRRGEDYELDLVLRNNRQTEEHPLGIFHPHADVHHIKKENIGLIEVMGLAVLPPRLLPELSEVGRYLAGQPANVAACHQPWAEELRRRHVGSGPIHPESASQIVRLETAAKFERVLADAGVYKRDAAGQAAFRRLTGHLAGGQRGTRHVRHLPASDSMIQ